MAKVIDYSQSEQFTRPVPHLEQKIRPLPVRAWLKKQAMNNRVASTPPNLEDLIRELMTRQDRQAKWILFLLVSWVFAGVFLALATLAR